MVPFAAQAAPQKERIHFLHLGKNAGTEIGRYIHAINQISPSLEIIKHPHDRTLKELPKKDRFFFSIRNPITRFYSGFYSRKRKGQPRIFKDWSSFDAYAFSNFEHANDLAESLFREDELGQKALLAISSIRHTAQNQIDWFYCCGSFLEVRPPVFIIRQEHFSTDMAGLLRRLGISRPINLESSALESHRNNYSQLPELSELALENLKKWYLQDIEFYKWCSAWVQRHAE